MDATISVNGETRPAVAGATVVDLLRALGLEAAAWLSSAISKSCRAKNGRTRKSSPATVTKSFNSSAAASIRLRVRGICVRWKPYRRKIEPVRPLCKTQAADFACRSRYFTSRTSLPFSL